ncbi:hypothetical protein KR093_004576 [Drosophila rubida]|uniref:Uncharacterized protein n=1 Tax=Drosophila rubida TaxID=30044 RepID=A0AAD4K712_9MUSC|nr:hypothetical protein KR093_004576 [Drosophila rubida]
MSERSLEVEALPRDAHVVHALRRELNRNTRRISQAFWQEFEQIRSQQRDQLAQERNNRERITTLMRETNLEAQQQLEALSRSISSHGINPAAPSPCMRRELPVIMPPGEEQGAQEQKTFPLRKVALKRRQIGARTPPPSTPNLPRAPPSSQATIGPQSSSSTSRRGVHFSSKSRPKIPKLAEKPRK